MIPLDSHSSAPRRGKNAPALTLIIALLISTTLTACKARGDQGSTPLTAGGAPILLFNGTGASRNDVTAVESVLDNNHLNYSTANSSQLNQMSESQIRAYRLLIIPGGNFVDMGNSLTPATTSNLREAVQNGVNYLGICGGGFLAGSFGSGYRSFNLTSGVQFFFYSAEGRGIRKAAVPISAAAAPTLDQYWEDGPQFTGWGAVVAKYPDGTPAVVEGTSGSGWVILTGVHPEAPEDWRRGMIFNTPTSADNDYAATLIRAALNRSSLAHY